MGCCLGIEAKLTCVCVCVCMCVYVPNDVMLDHINNRKPFRESYFGL